MGVADVFPPVLIGDRRIGGHDVDGLEAVALPDHPVVGIVGRGDFEEPGGHFCFGIAFLPAVFDGQDDIVVFDDRDDASDQREHDLEASHRSCARVLGVDRDCGIAHVGFGTGGGDGDPGLLVFGVVLGIGVPTGGQLAPGDGDGGIVGVVLDEGIAEVVEVPVHFFHLNFVVSQRGLGDRVPVDESFASVDEPIFEELEEGFADCAGADVVHREALTLPIARASHLLELVGDAGFVFVFEVVDELEELFAPGLAFELHFFVVGDPGFAGFFEFSIDHCLGGDPCVVGAGHPEGFVAFHSVGADEDVLDGVVEGVPEVEGSGDIGWGDEDAVGLSVAGKDTIGIGVEGIGRDPFVPDSGFVVAGRVGLAHGFFGSWFGCGLGGVRVHRIILALLAEIVESLCLSVRVADIVCVWKIDQRRRIRPVCTPCGRAMRSFRGCSWGSGRWWLRVLPGMRSGR